MSMFISYKGGRDKELWVQDIADNTTRYHLHGQAIGVESVQADGHELEYIKHRFSNLPAVLEGRVVRWFGDDAKFIVGNL